MRPDTDAQKGMDDEEENPENPEKLFVDLGMLVANGRQPEPSVKGRKEGVHCPPVDSGSGLPHRCRQDDDECIKAKQMESEMELLWQNNIPMSIEVLLYPDCYHSYHQAEASSDGGGARQHCMLLEQWTIQVAARRSGEVHLGRCMLIQAVRSYLHFSQLSSWYSSTHGKEPAVVVCRVCAPGESLASSFEGPVDTHEFPKAFLGRTSCMKVSVKSLTRQKHIPGVACGIPHWDAEEYSNGVHHNKTYKPTTQVQSTETQAQNTGARKKQIQKPPDVRVKDDYRTSFKNLKKQSSSPTGGEEQQTFTCSGAEKQQDNIPSTWFSKFTHNAIHHSDNGAGFSGLYNNKADDVEHIIEQLSLRDKKENQFVKHPAVTPEAEYVWFSKKEVRRKLEVGKANNSMLSNLLRKKTDYNSLLQEAEQERLQLEKEQLCHDPFENNKVEGVVEDDVEESWNEKSLSDDEDQENCSCQQQQQQQQCHIHQKHEDRGMVRSKTSPALASLGRRSIKGTTNTVFHPKTGLPINSSPAPPRRINRNSYNFERSMTNLNDVGFDQNTGFNRPLNASVRLLSKSAPPSTSSLLGNFEECVLNGRFEPVGTVDGFTAEIGASGSFCPKHKVLPVTAYFFDVSDDNAPSPYMTLFNPNKTVVKMFVVVYDLCDMPPNCQTFIRQRTFYMPTNANLHDDDDDESIRQLRYLIHLRFLSSKSGHIYLHTDIRLIFARNRADMDSGISEYELKSFTEMPSNPKFSPKK
ncbi:atos homolog protein A-like isoform X2 [Ptychodera flava]|uniref:atos homolog protein A-like isoform X2 n=1 Tax=Ptychodera flava TaxID=63121 RepID=UPI00396A1C98